MPRQAGAEPFAEFGDADIELSDAQLEAGLAVFREWEASDEWDARKLVRRLYWVVRRVDPEFRG